MRCARRLTLLLLGILGAQTVPASDTWDIELGSEMRTVLPQTIDRVSIANPAIADVVVVNAHEILVVGKSLGSTTLLLWQDSKQAQQYRVAVNLDLKGLHQVLEKALPEEKAWQIQTLGQDVVVSGRVSDVVAMHHLETIVTAFIDHGEVKGRGGRVINLLQIESPQQVEIHVQVAEVSRTFVEQWGGQAKLSGNAVSLSSNLQGPVAGNLGLQVVSGLFSGGLNLNAQEGVVKTLAEPTLLALSGQEASFLAGGKVFIPVTQSLPQGTALATLEEKEFGVALKFTPTVMKQGVIHLKVAPEVSEVNSQGLSLSSTGSTTPSVFPVFTSRRASTSVELHEGDSLVIGGLIQHQHNSTLQKFPWLGEIPVLGVLFRSAQFQKDDTELVFIVTPRRVSSLTAKPLLPTDQWTPPSHEEFFIEGLSESKASHSPDTPPEPSPGRPILFEGETFKPGYQRLLEEVSPPGAQAGRASNSLRSSP